MVTPINKVITLIHTKMVNKILNLISDDDNNGCHWIDYSRNNCL